MMKHTWMILATLAVMIASPSAVLAEWSAPTPDQMDALLSVPGDMAGLVNNATPEQAADVVVKAIAKVDASETLTEEQKKQLIARLVAYAVVKMGSKAPEMMALIVVKVDQDWLQTVVAAGMTAGRDYGDAMRQKIFEALGGEETPKGDLARTAMDDPKLILGVRLYNLVLVVLTKSTGGVTTTAGDTHNLVVPKGYIPQ